MFQIKDLMVHLDVQPETGKRLHFALELALRHDARLTGLFSVVDRHLGADGQPGDDIAGQVEAIGDEFKRKAEAAGVETRWVTNVSDNERSVAKAILAWASSSDMAIIGQENRARPSPALPRELPEYIILNAGRPIIVVPYACMCETIGDRVLVAFNGGREAARALNDSIPLLKFAREVRIALVNPHDLREGEHGVTDNDVIDHLSCHDIDIRIERLDIEGVSVMDMLLSRVAEEGKDMLVMGAYGHMSFPRLLRGSATRHILEHMTVPTLMSH